MAVSIARAQQGAINDGFLSGIGGARNEFTLAETTDALIAVAAKLIEEAQNNLDKGGHRSSGSLGDSISPTVPAMDGGKLVIKVEALEYYQFINSGVKGVKSGRSTAGYAFKYKMPSRKMVAEISRWIETSHKVTINTSRQHAISQTESKNNRVSQINSAWIVAKGIVNKGIKPTGFFDKAVQVAQEYAQEVLGKALVVDVVNALPNSI